jgi:hypothetical protein
MRLSIDWSDLGCTCLQLVLLLAWNCFYTTPANQENSLYALIFTTFDVSEQIVSTTSLVFADGPPKNRRAATLPMTFC